MVNEGKQWIETSDVIPMFPTLVWKLQIEAALRDALAAKIIAALTDLRGGLPLLEPGRGWQSTQSLHEREDFRELVSCVDRRRGLRRVSVRWRKPPDRGSTVPVQSTQHLGTMGPAAPGAFQGRQTRHGPAGSPVDDPADGLSQLLVHR